MKKQRVSTFVFQRTYVSAETIHLLFPQLPLDQLSDKDGLYDPIEALDLAEALGLRKKADAALVEVFGEDDLED